MYALDLLNNTDDPEQVKKQILEFSQKLRMTRYDLVFERMKRDLIF